MTVERMPARNAKSIRISRGGVAIEMREQAGSGGSDSFEGVSAFGVREWSAEWGSELPTPPVHGHAIARVQKMVTADRRRGNKRGTGR